MAPVPEAAFRRLLAGRDRAAVEAFVADLWSARGVPVERGGDRLLVDGRELSVVSDPAAARDADEGVVVSTVPPPAEADDAVLGPGDLHRMLLYDVPRERAGALFETHFGRPLEGDWPTPGEDRDGAERDPPDGGRGQATGPESAAPPPVVPVAVRRLLGGLAARLPSDHAEARATVGNRRVLAAVALLALLSGAGWWGLAVHRPAPAEPSAAPFDAADADLPVDGRYRVEARLATTFDGDTFTVVGSRTYAPEEPSVALARWTYGGPGGRTTVVQYVGNGSYTRQTWTNASDYRSFRQRSAGDPDFVRAVDATRAVYVADPDDRSSDPDPVLGVPLSVLAQLPYERAGTTTVAGRTAVRYVATTGWVTRSYGLLDDRRTTYVRAAAGEVLVARGSGAVLHADVDATVVDADTWWAALTGEGAGLTVRYTVRTGVDRPRPPPWVPADAANGNASGSTTNETVNSGAMAGAVPG